MSDRGLAPDVSPACPFVAFEDDRDGRSTRPDHRHRCFAELRPAPRATAHQEAFCLSAGFAGCPTFVDWARREAAQVRPAGGEGAAAGNESGDAPLPSQPPSAMPAMADMQSELDRRDSDRRDWAAPPPWAGSAAMAAAGASASAGSGEPPAAGSAEPSAEPGSPAQPAPAVEAPSFLATRASEPPRRAEPSRPAEPSQPAEPSPPAEPTRATAGVPPPRPRPAYPPADLDDELEARASYEEWTETEPGEPPMRRFGPAAGRSRYDDTHAAADAPRRRPPADPGGPSWEKPRRSEAYPTLRTRTGLAGVSPLLAAGIVIVLAAAALFFLPSFLLGLGGDGDGDATPTPSASGVTASATPDASPTPTPAPTPFVYTVKTGDTLSGIADQFDVTLDDLIAANPELEDPDKLDVGDKLIIPIGGLEPSPTPVEPSPSP